MARLDVAKWSPLLLPVFLGIACDDASLTPIEPNEPPPPAADAGGVMLDAGTTPPKDGGTAQDAGVAMDAGSSQPDSGPTPTPDAGQAPGPDAGSPGVPACTTDLTSQLGALQVPGLSAGIIKNGRLVCTAVAGHANIEQDLRVTPDTVFAWASVSKTVTGVAAMILVEQGVFGLDDNINDHLPFTVTNPECAGGTITIRQLMTHSSSIIDNWDVYDALYTVGESPIVLGDFLNEYFVPGGQYYDEDENFDYECPGEYYEYSNVAVGLLGYLVEYNSGVPFDQFCRDNIFTPLGMNEASFRLAPLNQANIAMPYDRMGANFVAHGHVGLPTAPDGSLRTSVPQLARFLAMMDGMGQVGGTRIISEASAQEMSSLQIQDLENTQGLIWFYQDFNSRTGMLGHDGSDPGTSSLMFFDPSRHTGVLLVANGDWYGDADDVPAADALMEALFLEAESY